MKQVLIINALTALLAVGSLADARLVSTRVQCVAACGNATTQTCGWITKQGKFSRCRTKLLNQCKRFGTTVMCPPPPGAPTPPPPPTMLPPPPPPTTTTTVPYVPPTTTTLPAPVNPADQYGGVWTFYGTLYSNNCSNMPTTLSDTLSLGIYPANPGAASGYLASGPAFFTGGVESDGSLTLGAEFINSYGCIVDVGLSLAPPAGGDSTYGGVAFVYQCPGVLACTTTYSAVWYR